MTFDFDKLITIGSDKWKTAPFRFYGEKEPFFIGNKIEQKWQDIILKGVTALTLVNAKANSLEYLSLFGNAELLPEQYLDTVVLSGGLEQRNLPSGYTEVSGVTNTSDQSINFGASLNQDDEIEFAFSYTDNTTTGEQIFGYRTGANSQNITAFFAGTANRIVIDFNNSTYTNYRLIADIEPNKIYTVYLSKSRRAIYQGSTLIGENTTVCNDTISIEAGTALLYNVGGTPAYNRKFAGTIYYLKIKNKRDMVAAKRNSDNAVGFYNDTSNTYFYSLTDGTAGADVVPTPDTPMDIVCNNGTIKVSKNVFDYEYFYDNYQIYSGSQVGRCPIRLQPNTKYTVSTNTEVSSSSAKIFVTSGSDINWTPSTATNGVPINSPRTVTTDSYGYLCIGIYYTGGNEVFESDFVNGTVWVQIEQGSTATPYMPYGIYTDSTQEVVTDSLGNTANAERLLAVSDYKDTQEVISGSVTRNIGVKVLDGTEYWLLATGTGYRQFYISTTQGVIKNSVSLVSNIAPYGCTSDTRTNYQYGCYSGGTGYLCFQMIGSSTLTTVAEFKQFLANQYTNGTPIIVVYPLATATTESVTGQFLSKSPVTQTAGSISNLPIAITESQKTVPTPQQPLDINCNNGVVKVSPNLFTRTGETLDKYYNASGVEQNGDYTAYSFAHTDFIKVQPNTTYTFGFKVNFSSNGNINHRIIGWTSSKSYVKEEVNVIEPQGAAVGTLLYDTFTTSATTEYVTINFVYTPLETELQLVEGSALPTPYMPYGQIYVDGTTETVQITGKNLFNQSLFVGDSGSITYYASYQVPNGTYTMSSPDFPLLTNVTNVFFLAGNVSSGANSTTNGVAINKPVTITVTDGYYTVGHRYTTSANTNHPAGYNWQVEEGSTATTYEPYYNGGTATAQPLYKIGTYQDVQSVIDGSVTRNVGIKVLDGTENWTQVSSSSAPFALVVDDFKSMNIGDRILVYSTHFRGVPATATWANYNSMISFTGSQGSEAKTFRVRYLANTKTLAEFKQFLAEQYAQGTPVICVYYKQETTETVTAQPMNIQEGTNVVTITQASMDDLELEVKYKAGVAVTITEIQNAQLDNNVEVTING